MRIGSSLFLTLCFAVGLSAQIRGVGSVVNPAGGAGTPGVTRTTGSVVNPAGGVPRPAIQGLRGTTGSNRTTRGVYAYPVYIGGYYAVPYISTYPYIGGDSSGSGQAPVENNITVVTPPAPVTPVVINYNYGSASAPVPVPNTDTQGASQDQDTAPEPAHYLIAMKDHTIFVATAYWVDGDTLHYFTAGNVHNQASISLVDRDFTQRLNKEAGVDVSIPAPAK